MKAPVRRIVAPRQSVQLLFRDSAGATARRDVPKAARRLVIHAGRARVAELRGCALPSPALKRALGFVRIFTQPVRLPRFEQRKIGQRLSRGDIPVVVGITKELDVLDQVRRDRPSVPQRCEQRRQIRPRRRKMFVSGARTNTQDQQPAARLGRAKRGRVVYLMLNRVPQAARGMPEVLQQRGKRAPLPVS